MAAAPWIVSDELWELVELAAAEEGAALSLRRIVRHRAQQLRRRCVRFNAQPQQGPFVGMKLNVSFKCCGGVRDTANLSALSEDDAVRLRNGRFSVVGAG